MGVGVDDGALMDAAVYIGDADQDADAAVGELLGPLDLVEILGGVVVDGGPEQVAQVLDSGIGGRSRWAWMAASSAAAAAGKSG